MFFSFCVSLELAISVVAYGNCFISFRQCLKVLHNFSSQAIPGAEEELVEEAQEGQRRRGGAR